MNTLRLILLLLVGLAFNAFPQAPVFTLDSIFSHIDRHNPMLGQFEERSKAQLEYAKGAKSWMAPMAGAGLWMYPYPGQEIMEERDKGMAMFSIEQSIPNPAKLKANQKYQESRSALEEAGRSYAFNELRSEAKALYYECIVLEKKMSNLRENEAILQLMIKLEKIRYPYGQGKLSNVYKSEAKLYEIQNMIEMTQTEIGQKAIMLNVLMHNAPDYKFTIDTSLQVKSPITNVADTTYLSATRSDIRQIDLTIASMRLNSRLEEFQLKPEFKIRYNHMQPLSGERISYGHGEASSKMPSQFTLEAMVSIPIAPWSSKMSKANVKGMNYEIRAMQKEKDHILNEAQGMIATMAVEIKSLERQLKNYEAKIIPSLKKNYETEMLAYEENQNQLPMVIDAWETLNMNQMKYLENLEKYYLMIVNYEKELEK